MKHLKILALAAVAATALMAFAGAGSAVATTLTNPVNTKLATGTKIAAENEGAITLTTVFLHIACQESQIQGKTTNESGPSISGNVEILTFGNCNCEVVVLKKGTFLITSEGNGNGLFTSNEAELTTKCSTVFGVVHCIYRTATTHLGTLTGSDNTKATATLDIVESEVPVVATDALCNAEAKLDAKYKVTNPDSLFID